MSDVQFFETRMGRQYYDVTLPELVRQLHRLNDLLALSIDQLEQKATAKNGSDALDGPTFTAGRQR